MPCPRDRQATQVYPTGFGEAVAEAFKNNILSMEKDYDAHSESSDDTDTLDKEVPLGTDEWEDAELHAVADCISLARELRVLPQGF